MEYSGDVWTDEDRDFVVEDGYKHDEDQHMFLMKRNYLMMINMLLQVKILKN